MTNTAVVIVPPHMHRTQQAVDAFATHRHTTGIRLTVRADAASSFVSVPFFVALRRPPPRPWLPRHAPDHAARTPSCRTTRRRLCRPTAWPSVATPDLKPCPRARKSAAPPHSTPTLHAQNGSSHPP